MGYYRCAVLMCRNNTSKAKSSSEKNIKYYPFPVNTDLRIKWIVACQSIEEWTPESSYICSEHFAETDFERDLKAELLNLPPKKILKPGAVPTLNLSDSNFTFEELQDVIVRQKLNFYEYVRNIDSSLLSSTGFIISHLGVPKLVVSPANTNTGDFYKSCDLPDQHITQIDNINEELSNKTVLKLDELCRLCGCYSPRRRFIFDIKNNYSEIIDLHFPDIVICKDDLLPVEICSRCESILLSWCQFYKTCNAVNKRFQLILETLSVGQNTMNYSDNTEESTGFKVETKNPFNAVPFDTGEINELTFEEDSDIPEIEIVEITTDLADPETLEIYPEERFEVKETSANFLANKLDIKEEDTSDETTNVPSHVVNMEEEKIEIVEQPHELVKEEDIIFEQKHNLEKNCDETEYESSDIEDEVLEKKVLTSRLSRIKRDMVGNNLRRRRKRMPALSLRRMCHICGKIFKYPESLRRHLKTVHSDERPFKCHLCTSSFNRNHNLTIHIKVVHQHQRVYVKKHVPRLCDYCGKVLLSARSLEEHISSIHTKKALYECDKCHSTFYRKLTFDKHRTSEECDSANPKKCNAPKTEEVFLKYCEFCGLEFKKEHFYMKHKLKHMNNFVCSICSVNFEDSTLLKEHVDTEHPEVKPFECEVCGKKFKNKPLLNCHLIIHTGEKRYQCQYCSLKFLKKKYLSTHILTHTGERPFVCTICGRGFKQSGDMRKHKATHIRKQI